jgi:phasin family protein
MAPRTAKKTTTKAKAAPKAAEKTIDLSFVAKAREAIEDRVETLTERAKDAWETTQTRVKAARDGAADAVGVVRSSLEAAGAGARDVNLKVIEFVQADANTYFDTVKKVATAKSIKEALEIQGAYVRTQFQTGVKNLRTVREMAADATREAFQPVREGFASLRKAA